jgi:hypothetical protein
MTGFKRGRANIKIDIKKATVIRNTLDIFFIFNWKIIKIPRATVITDVRVNIIHLVDKPSPTKKYKAIGKVIAITAINPKLK